MRNLLVIVACIAVNGTVFANSFSGAFNVLSASASVQDNQVNYSGGSFDEQFGNPQTAHPAISRSGDTAIADADQSFSYDSATSFSASGMASASANVSDRAFTPGGGQINHAANGGSQVSISNVFLDLTELSLVNLSGTLNRFGGAITPAEASITFSGPQGEIFHAEAVNNLSVPFGGAFLLPAGHYTTSAGATASNVRAFEIEGSGPGDGALLSNEASATYQFTITVVPEPSSLVALPGGFLGLLATRRRSQQRRR